jgi:serine/threonine protein kinase
MNSLEGYVGQTLDEKYRLERLLGQGGMGAVYLATHLGTERYVALKLITPQFMRNLEFVERFKREARAAGRLRHPNVVDVTDFGFASTGKERVAYLVMEYLDGCTLSDVLAEETSLPLYWVVDILEQVCSAVHEAHQQGILHRDLKPDNIWLEPNALGGYRVKVLDFGIAKLAEVGVPGSEVATDRQSADSAPTGQPSPTPVAATAEAGISEMETRIAVSPMHNLESETLIRPTAPSVEDVQAKRVADGVRSTQAGEDGDQTLLLDGAAKRTDGAGRPTTDPSSTSATTGLTRVGAILGTPLYMSPEQCRGEHLDARSDIYSLGIIAYQMLAGTPPFTGQATSVISAHTNDQPTPLQEHNVKLLKRVSHVVMSALEKDPAARPQTAAAFANALRANADGLGALYRRAFSLYSEYFPKFLKLSLMAHIPVIITTLTLLALRLAEPRLGKVTFNVIVIPVGLLHGVAQWAATSFISGVTAIIITQLAVAPLKPVELRTAIDVLRRRWRPFLRTGIRLAIRTLLGWMLFLVPGMIMTVRYLLWGPVVLMEGLETKAARQRARALASRSWRTIIVVTLIQFLVPMCISATVGAIVGILSGGLKKDHNTVTIKVGTQLTSFINIFVVPLMSIVPALLYLKMRQFGGETLNDVMTQLEEVEPARSQWQQRMRKRLTMNTPMNTPQNRT